MKVLTNVAKEVVEEQTTIVARQQQAVQESTQTLISAGISQEISNTCVSSRIVNRPKSKIGYAV